MNATLTKSTRNGTKTIIGEILQRGIGYITIVIINKSGSKEIKRYKLSDYVVKTY